MDPVCPDNLPDPLALMLVVDEVALGTRRVSPDAEPLEVAVANIVGGLAGFESIDLDLVETKPLP